MMTIIFAFCVLIPMMYMGVFFMHNIVEESEQQNQVFLDHLNTQIMNSLDMISEEIQNIGKIPHYRWDILQILRSDYSSNYSEYVEKCRDMAEVIGVLVQTNNKFLRITFVTRNGDIFSQFTPPYLESPDTLLAHIEEMAPEEDIRAFSVQKIIMLDSVETCVPFVVRLTDPHTAATVGFAEIDLKYSALEELLGGKEGVSVLLLSGQECLYNSAGLPEDSQLYKALAGEEALESGEARAVEENAHKLGYLTSSWKQPVTGWRVVTYASSELNRQNVIARSSYYISQMLIVFVIVLCMLSPVMRWFVESVKRLRNAMIEARRGRLGHLEIDDAFTNEVATLYESYNDMVEDIEHSIQSEYELELQQKRTENLMLLSQINPHFLYNALNLLRSVIDLGKHDLAVKLLGDIAAMFRYSSHGSEKISIREEIEQVDRYLSIQMMRYPDRVKAKVYLDPAVEEYRIAKFILQPLVENCFKHGMENKAGYWIVKVMVVRRADDLLMTVSDNGAGMSAEELAHLRERLRKAITATGEEPQDGGGIGLTNVHRRLYYTYGDAYEMSISSEKGLGMQVQITIAIEKLERE